MSHRSWKDKNVGLSALFGLDGPDVHDIAPSLDENQQRAGAALFYKFEKWVVDHFGVPRSLTYSHSLIARRIETLDKQVQIPTPIPIIRLHAHIPTLSSAILKMPRVNWGAPSGSSGPLSDSKNASPRSSFCSARTPPASIRVPLCANPKKRFSVPT